MKGKIVSLSRTPVPQVRYVQNGDVKFSPIIDAQKAEAMENINKVVEFEHPECNCFDTCPLGDKYCEKVKIIL